MRVSITVGETTREITIEKLLEHPGMERDAQDCIGAQLIGLFESALENEWAKARTEIAMVCDAMGWGYTR
jgi:hypothetical protein